MEMDAIMTAITTVGFPIVMCIGMALAFWKLARSFKNSSEQQSEHYVSLVKEQMKIHAEDTLRTVEALDELTGVVKLLADRIGGDHNG